MKHLFISACVLFAANTAGAQNTAWGTTAGYLTGVGTTSPAFPFHFHGTTDYVTDVNYGVSTWIGFTNTNTGAASTDGVMMRLSLKDFNIENRENGHITIRSNGANMTLIGNTNRAFFGITTTSSSTVYGLLNVRTATDNGLYINTLSAGRYGLSVKMHTDEDNAIQVVSPVANQFAFFSRSNGQAGIRTHNLDSTDDVLVIENDTRRILQLENNGLLYAREIHVNADTWADFVFEPGYELLPLQKVEDYISKEGHLPGVPSASFVLEEGIYVAEMNKLLLQKIEELTLYIIEQDKKILELQPLLNKQTGAHE